MNLPLNILINNAGVMYCPFKLSEDGVEMQFATNHLGHFLLTNLLLEKLKTTAKKTGIESCIVNLSSVAHVGPYNEGIKFDKLNDKKAYNDMMAYGQSNLANILHSNELARCWKEEGKLWEKYHNSIHTFSLFFSPLYYLLDMFFEDLIIWMEDRTKTIFVHLCATFSLIPLEYKFNVYICDLNFRLNETFFSFHIHQSASILTPRVECYSWFSWYILL
ncbi:short-chain dehydrogenase TIC 32 A, chloroplastic-like isoform X1 [Zingiber officinale]|uniref:short-chain dehydrogenase TIC 32 A, chloroplastic-like isoform X1 n=1 Tax=Zingiber officinale TaxID=94328 RepID=UPI001C4B2980|nr:short-chain dehydrogenase TIC 32 A, chloroplastic-like isoform X1 [Zingiber officinale]